MPEDGHVETDLKNASNLLVSPETSDMPSGGVFQQHLDGLMSEVVGAVRTGQGVGLIDKQHAAQRTLDDAVCQRGGEFPCRNKYDPASAAPKRPDCYSVDRTGTVTLSDPDQSSGTGYVCPLHVHIHR